MKKLWVETYRPRFVADVILAPEMRKKFDNFVSDQSIPNLLLTGIRGTGKSTISKALIRDLKVDRSDVLRIACSDEKIDGMRDKVKNFSMTMPNGEFKIVQLEEFDMLSLEAQGLLRSLIEDTSNSCRFIATCNYINKVIPELRSRFQEFTFTAPDRDQVLLLMADILVKEAVEFDVDDLEKVVAAGYPDVRKIIQLMEANSGDGVLKLDNDGGISDWKLSLLPLIEAGDIRGCRKLVCESATKEELIDVYRYLYDNLHRCKKLKKQDEAVVLIAQYQYQHSFVSDQELQVAALFIELANLV